MNLYVTVFNGEEEQTIISRLGRNQLEKNLKKCTGAEKKKYENVLKKGITLLRGSEVLLRCISDDAWLIKEVERKFTVYEYGKSKKRKIYQRVRIDLEEGDIVEISSNCCIWIT